MSAIFSVFAVRCLMVTFSFFYLQLAIAICMQRRACLTMSCSSFPEAAVAGYVLIAGITRQEDTVITASRDFTRILQRTSHTEESANVSNYKSNYNCLLD